jgi:hypothetical protein
MKAKRKRIIMKAKRKRPRKRARTLSMVKSRGAYSISPMGRATRRRSATKSATGRGISSVTSAATATLVMWLAEAAVNYGFKAMNIQTPKSRALVPGLIALLAYKGKINIPGLLPIAVAQTMNTIKQTSPAIQSAFTFDGYGARPRSYAETVAAIRASSPQPQAQYSGMLTAPMPNFNGLMTAPMPNFNGYSQPF